MQESLEQGYDDARFRVAVDDEDLHCPICLNVLNDPVQCERNEHHFCRPCIKRHLEDARTCPSCKDELSLKTVKKASRFIANNLAKLESRPDDVESCGFSPVVCTNDSTNDSTNDDGCEEVAQGRYLHSHQTYNCVQRAVVCQDCVGVRTELNEMKKRLQDINTEVQQLKRASAGTCSACHVIVAGGRNASSRLSSVEAFDCSTREWTPWEPMDEPRAAASASVYEGQVFVVGGRGRDSVDTANISTMSVGQKTKHWSKFPGCTLPVKCSGHTTVAYKDRLLVIGGGSNGFISDSIHEVVLIPPYSCKRLCTMPDPTYFHGSERFGAKVFVVGGSSTATKTSLSNRVTMFDVRLNECTQMAPMPFAVGCMATVRWGVNIIVVGGCSERGNVLNSVVMYNTETGRSEMLPPMRHRRRGCTAVVAGNLMIVMGGISEEKYLSSVEGFCFDRYCWEELPSMIEPRAFAASFAWQGSV